MGAARPVTRVALSPDGTAVLTVGSNQTHVTIWDAHSLEKLGVLSGQASRVTAIAVSPDGLRAAASDNFGAIKIWDLPTRREVATLHGHRGRALGLAFSPDGRWLFSAAADWTVRMWEGTPPILRAHQHGG